MRENDLTIVIGRKGSGKTTRARELVSTRARRIFIDPMHEQNDGVLIRDYRSLVHYLRGVRHAPRYSVVFRSMSEGDNLAAIALATAGDAEHPPLPGVTYIVDEVDRLCSPTRVPVPLKYLANYGRHFRASAVLIARRAKQMPLDFRANADRYIIGETFEPSDVDALAEFIGPELADKVRELRAPEFVQWPPPEG